MSREKIIVRVDSELQDLVPNFLEKRRKEISSMWDLLNNKDFTTLQTLGHRIKGNAGGYGFDHMGTLGAEIEIAAKSKDSSKIEKTIKQLEHYLSHVEVVFEDVA